MSFKKSAPQVEDQLRALAREVERSGERERLVISQGLHDQVGPTLASVRMRLGTLARRLPPEDGREIEEMRDDLRHSLDSIRSLMFEPTNPLLYQVGLGIGLESLCNSLQSDRGLSVRLRCDDDLSDYPQEAAMTCYRVVKEMLLNVAQHSGAATASLTISLDDARLRMEIVDAGQGFDPAEFEDWGGEMRGFGLFLARERIARLGGRLEIDSAPNRGTRVRIEIPVRNGHTGAPGGSA